MPLFPLNPSHENSHPGVPFPVSPAFFLMRIQSQTVGLLEFLTADNKVEDETHSLTIKPLHQNVSLDKLPPGQLN